MQFCLAAKITEEICHQSLKISYKANVFIIFYYFYFKSTQKLQNIFLQKTSNLNNKILLSLKGF